MAVLTLDEIEGRLNRAVGYTASEFDRTLVYAPMIEICNVRAPRRICDKLEEIHRALPETRVMPER